MTRKRFDYLTGELTDPRGHNSRVLKPSVTPTIASEELYRRVGGRFRVDWQPWSSAEPIIHTDRLPAGVSEADVRDALVAMRADGIL